MQTTLYPFVFAIVLLMMASISAVQAAPAVYGIYLENRLTDRGDKHYNHLLQRMEEMGFEHQLQVSPLKRHYREVLDDPAFCAFPVTLHSIRAGAYDDEVKARALVSAQAVDYVTIRIFTRGGEPTIGSLSDLEGKRVALWAGLDPAAHLPGVNANIVSTRGEDVRLKMLDAHRLDAIVGFMPDVQLASKKLELPIPEYDYRLELLYVREGATLVCVDTPENRQRVQTFDKILSQLKESGELRTILGPLVDVAD